MSIVKFINESYKRKQDMFNLISYIASGAEAVSGYGVSLDCVENICMEFEFVKRYWNKAEEGRRQVRHFIVSFNNSEMPLTVINCIARQIGAIYGNRFQVFYGIHLDTEHPHIHYAINTVNFVDGSMFSEGYGDLCKLEQTIKLISDPYEKYKYYGGGVNADCNL